jgi:hypothetical protein
MITFLLDGQAVGSAQFNSHSVSRALGALGAQFFVDQYNDPTVDPTLYKGFIDNCAATAASMDPSNPVQIRAFEFRPNGSRFLDGVGVPRGSVRIEVSNDMQTFTDAATITADDAGHFEWEDPEAVTHRFYRASSP